MSQSTYQSIVLAKRPTGEIVPEEVFTLKTNPILTEADLKDGEILVETLYLSLDPAMRAWLNDVRSYVPPVQIGAVMRSLALGKVIASKDSSFPVGSHVSCPTGWTELSIHNPSTAPTIQIITLPPGAQLTDSLGVLGPTGLTAYYGIIDVAKVKPGDFVVVSGAAGATGSIACQIAKLKGARVMGIAGSEEKVKWLKELGCDEALNYKSENFRKEFREKTKDLIDVFFDNVGGEVLELAFARAQLHARFVICGAISQYNNEGAMVGPKNFQMIIASRIQMQGFLVFDYVRQFPSALHELSTWLSEGKIQRKETILKGGLQAAPQGLVDLYKGINTGKLLLEVKSESGEGLVSRL